MSCRSAVGHLPVRRPGQEPLLSNLIHQRQQAQMPFDQHRPGALVAAIFGGTLSHFGPLCSGHGVEPILSGLAAGQDVSRMELAASAPAVGFSALAAEQIEGALNHRLRALEAAQGGGQGGVSAPELLPEFGDIGVQLYVLHIYRYRLASKKSQTSQKTVYRPRGDQNKCVLRAFRGPSPTV